MVSDGLSDFSQRFFGLDGLCDRLSPLLRLLSMTFTAFECRPSRLDHLLDFFRTALGPARQGSDFVSDDRKTASLFTGAGRLNCGIQRQ